MKLSDVDKQLARLHRADTLGLEISKSIQTWGPKSLSTRPIIHADRNGWHLELVVLNPPPYDEWSMLFSDAIGQLRNTLDNFVFSVLTPMAPDQTSFDARLIKFPIVSNASKWGEAKKAIRHIPEPFLSRIEDVQPFRFTPASSQDKYGLSILQKLSNSDKHTLQVIPSITTREINHNISMEFETVYDATISMPPEMEVLNPVFENGAHLLRHTTAGKLRSVSSHAKVTSQVMIDIDGDFTGITSILAGLWEHTAKILVYVADLPPKEFEDWANSLS
jgi:hypothetical protein